MVLGWISLMSFFVSLSLRVLKRDYLPPTTHAGSTKTLPPPPPPFFDNWAWWRRRAGYFFFTKKPDLHFAFPCAFYFFFFFFFFVSGRLGGRQAFGWLFNLVWVAAKIVPFSFVFFFHFLLLIFCRAMCFCMRWMKNILAFFACCCVLRLREKKRGERHWKLDGWMDGWMKGWLDFLVLGVGIYTVGVL